ncbi:TPA: hypothetical protein QDZ10_002999 [Stenotrophomonas maltophilia]|nr:hypothetical protein [Stenotrophomonas maltophilia]
MSINFKPRENSSFDEGSGVTISHPRIQLDAPLDGVARVEYQYTFRRGGERVGAMGFFGTEVAAELDGQRGLIYTLDLGPPEVLMDMLKFKRFLGDTSDAFVFVRCLAQGLVNVFVARLAQGLLNALAGQTDNKGALSYIAVTSVASLDRAGVPVVGTVPVLSDGTVVLAEVAIPNGGI